MCGIVCLLGFFLWLYSHTISHAWDLTNSIHCPTVVDSLVHWGYSMHNWNQGLQPSSRAAASEIKLHF